MGLYDEIICGNTCFLYGGVTIVASELIEKFNHMSTAGNKWDILDQVFLEEEDPDFWNHCCFIMRKKAAFGDYLFIFMINERDPRLLDGLKDKINKQISPSGILDIMATGYSRVFRNREQILTWAERTTEEASVPTNLLQATRNRVKTKIDIFFPVEV